MYPCLVGGVCLAIWLQFNHFEVRPAGERFEQEQLAQVTKELTAQDRAEDLAQYQVAERAPLRVEFQDCEFLYPGNA